MLNRNGLEMLSREAMTNRGGLERKLINVIRSLVGLHSDTTTDSNYRRWSFGRQMKGECFVPFALSSSLDWLVMVFPIMIPFSPKCGYTYSVYKYPATWFFAVLFAHINIYETAS